MGYEPRPQADRPAGAADLARLRSLTINRLAPAEGATAAGPRSRAWPWAAAGAAAGLVAGALGAAALLAAAAEARRAPSDAPAAPEPAGAVQALPGAVVASGYVEARQSATVASEVTGRLVRLAVQEGQRVRAGEVLAELDDLSARAQLDSSLAQAEAARAQTGVRRAALDEAERDLGRHETLAQQGYVAAAVVQSKRSLVDQARADYQAALKTLSAYQASVAGARSLLGKYVIVAPFAGVITSTNAEVGEIISPMSAGGGFTRTGICTIVSMERLAVEVSVAESLISRLAPGQAAEVVLDAYPDMRLPARIEAIVPAADREKSAIRVRVALLRTDPRVLPDMAAKVIFTRNSNEPASPAAL